MEVIENVDLEPSSQINERCKQSRLHRCEVCGKSDAKYTCPKCEVKTCCLDCVKIHKKELNCDGVRDRTKFLSLNNFSNSDFYNDYAFLEECSRFVYGKQRNVAKRYTNVDKPLPHYLMKMKRVCREKGIVLLLLPEHFSRRRGNISRVTRGGHLLWRLDWFFGEHYIPHSGFPIAEDTRLGQLLQEKLEEQDSHLDCYKAAGVSNIRLFLKVERVKGSSGKYYELDADKSLRENLVGKCLVEYPVIHVLLRDHSYGLEVVHSDDDIEDDIKTEKGTSQAVSVEKNIKSEISMPIKATNENTSADCRRDNSRGADWRRDNSRASASGKRNHYGGELATVRVARQQREKIRKEMKEEEKKKPKNLLFVTGYSSEENGIESSGEESG